MIRASVEEVKQKRVREQEIYDKTNDAIMQILQSCPASAYYTGIAYEK